MAKLKASMKSFQEAVNNIKPIGPIRATDAKTHSFRAVDGSCSIFSSSSSLSIQESKTSEQREKRLPDGRMSSKRFFFSPRNTKSIMEEAKQTSGRKESAGGSFYEESVVMAMVSEDPYVDFKCSMAEMVEAHELSDWQKLQELLHCYLRLNERKNHKVIVLAFVDLLMQLIAQDRNIFSFSSAPLCLSSCALGM